LLKKIRAYLRQIGANAIIIPHDDAFFSEDLSPENERLAWISGFTGSAGVAIITLQKAVLFVDGRYVEQAKRQTTFDVLHVPHQTTLQDWLAKFLKTDYTVAYNPWLQSVAQVEKWETLFEQKKAKLLPIEFDELDAFWENRPLPKKVLTFDYPIKYAGQTTQQKTALVQSVLKAKNIDAFILTNTDSVSWLLNKRSNATDFNPVVLDRLIIFQNAKAVSFNQKNLVKLKGKTVAIDKFETPVKIKQMLQDVGAVVQKFKNPVVSLQALKNKAEIKGMKKAALLDSIAVCRFLALLPSRVQMDNEYNVVQYLDEFRKENALYYGKSFEHISAVGKNSALPHYQAKENDNKKLAGQKIYLLDTGAQYLCGTTDMTRTIALSAPTQEMKEQYTQVLKGHIALMLQIFPYGTTGGALDALARQFLWNNANDFDHGTGHGIGCFLNVHETPPSISPYDKNILQENMILSNEPGFYKAGHFGIRIENMMQVVRKKTTAKKILGFEVLTFVPFCDELIQMESLNELEKQWIKAYYQQILKFVYPKVDVKTKLWLSKQTQRWIV